MKKILFAGFLFLAVLKGYGQINMNDSTVQVIGYWDKNEKETYIVTTEEIKIQGSDTLSRELIKYTVDITVTDSTADSYIIDWVYRDYEVRHGGMDAAMTILGSITENMTVTIRTSELGEFEEVVNWREVRDYIRKGIRTVQRNMEPLLKKRLSDSGNNAVQIPDSVSTMFDRLFQQMETMFGTKESIDAVAIKEIQQFYTFHGSQYKLWEEYSATTQAPNTLGGGEPFDVNMTVWLDEITPDDNDYVIRAKQEFDPEQLRKATYGFLVKTAEATGVTPPSPDDIPPMKNEVLTASVIHGSGWVIYSVMTIEVTAEGRTNIKETIIDLQ